MKLSLVINASRIDQGNDKIKQLKVNLIKANILYHWIENDLLHITLLNLGEVNTSEIQEIKTKIKSIISYHTPFNLTLNSVSAYPNPKGGRLIWIGVENSASLQSLQRDLALNLIGKNTYIKEKLFRPVLPIVRLKNNYDLTDIISPFKNTPFGKIKVNQLLLFDLMMGDSFPVYKLLNTYMLNSNQNKMHKTNNIG